MLLDGDEKISAVIDLKEYSDGRYLLFATRKGIVKKTALPEYDSPRTGLIAINLRGDDELIDVKLTEGEDEVIMVSRKGQAIRFKESLARPMGRATGGVIGMRLAEDDRVLAVGLTSEGEEMISVTEQGYGKRSKLSDYPTKGRGGKGVIGHQLTAKTGQLAGAYIGSKDIDMFVISSSGQVVRVPAGADPPGGSRQPGRAHDAGRGRRHRGGARPRHHADGRGRRRLGARTPNEGRRWRPSQVPPRIAWLSRRSSADRRDRPPRRRSGAIRSGRAARWRSPSSPRSR